jgi:hypothetical protein
VSSLEGHRRPLPQLVLRAALAAGMIGLASALLFLALGMVTRWGVFEWLLGGGSRIWNALFGGPWDNLIWLFAMIALNAVIYAAVVFVVEIALIVWEHRRTESASSDLRLR